MRRSGASALWAVLLVCSLLLPWGAKAHESDDHHEHEPMDKTVYTIPLCDDTTDEGRWFLRGGDSVKVYTNHMDSSMITRTGCPKGFPTEKGYGVSVQIDLDHSYIAACNLAVDVYDGQPLKENRLKSFYCHNIADQLPVVSKSNFVTIAIRRSGPPQSAGHDVTLSLTSVPVEEGEGRLDDSTIAGMTAAIVLGVAAIGVLMAVAVVWNKRRTEANRENSKSDEEEGLTDSSRASPLMLTEKKNGGTAEL